MSTVRVQETQAPNIKLRSSERVKEVAILIDRPRCTPATRLYRREAHPLRDGANTMNDVGATRTIATDCRVRPLVHFRFSTLLSTGPSVRLLLPRQHCIVEIRQLLR